MSHSWMRHPTRSLSCRHERAIVLVNAQAERLFGYRRDEILGQPIEMLVPDWSATYPSAAPRGYVENPQPPPMGAGMELAGRSKDGSEFPAEISLSGRSRPKGRPGRCGGP